MSNSFILGKNGNFGNIDFSKLRSGITKKDLGIEGDTILATIFDSIDNAKEGESKGNGKLERNELIAFINKIRELAGKDTTISESEAENYELNGEKLRKNKEDLLTFISKLAELTKGVKNVSVSSNAEIITYENGHTEQIFSDGSKIITVKNGNKTTVSMKNADDKTTEEIVEEDGTTTKTEYEKNSTNPKKQTITNQETETIILYSNGKKISQNVTNKQTGEIQEFGFDEQGNPVLKKTTKSGEVTLYSGGVPSEKTTTTQTDEGTRVSHIIYDGNNSTENVSVDGKIYYQKKVIDGVKYEVRYDENGNTLGVIVQNGESIQAIAKKFGVAPEELVKVNANLLKGKRYFNVGDEIKIPRKMEADEYSKAQEGRLNKEGAVQECNAYIARRKAEAERREAERQAKIGDEIARGQNGYYVTKTSDGNLHYWNPNKKEIPPEEFKKVCPSIYENVTQTQRGATKRTRNKYDIPTIKRQAGDLAKKIHSQIDGASINENTINLLRGITQENAAFVISEYQRMFNVSLAKDIDDEWGLDINTIKEHICKKLVVQAKSLGIQGIYYGDYQKINDISSLQKWINNTSAKIINTMSNAKETYYATNAEETQRQQSRELQKTAKTEAEQIVNDLIKETSGYNDVDKIKDIIRRIDKPEEIAEVNRLLTLKDYPPTDKYSAIENYIYKEANNSIAHTYNSSDYLEQTVQEWINNGTLKGQAANEAQARMAARVLYDGGDGFGTDPDKIKKAVRMIKCPKPTGNRAEDNKQAREVYQLVNNMIKKHNTFYGLGSASTDLLDYCRGELWESEVKYLNGILAETNAIKGQEKAQAVSDLTEEAVSGAGTDIEYLEQAIKGIDSPEDRKAVEAKLKEYCSKKGIKLQIEGQAYLQAILYDECDTFMGISTDHKEIRKFNEMLISQGAYTEEEIVNLRAEQVALQILEGNFDNIKDAVEQIKDKKVLAKLEQLLTTKGYKSLDDFLSQKLNSTKSDLINAELASNNLLANEKAADVAYRLMKNSDFDNRAMGVRAIRNETVAKMVDEKLKKDGSSLAKFMEQFNKEKAEYKLKADFWDGWGKFLVGSIAEDISDAYRENTDSSDNMFIETQQTQTLTPEQKAVYQMTVKLMEQKFAQMEKDYQAALDTQGAVSWAVNRLCEENFGIGTTREEIQARIEQDRETIRLLKLAADGKLGKMEKGKTVAVSFEAVFKERNIDTNFDIAKVEKVQKQVEMLGAMDYAKTNIAVCWQEIDNGLNSTDAKRLTVAILDTLDKLSTMSGRELSLTGYGYKVKDSIIFDSADNPVPPEKLRELANQLKQGLADVAKDLLGQEIPLNTSSSKINEVLEEAYNTKKESFKQEFKDAFGQDAPDEIIDSYISTINTGTTIVNIVALIGAAIAAPFTGGGSLAVFAAVAGTSFGLNALEKSTDANGYTNSEWTTDAEQALWDGVLAAVGMKIGKYAEGFAQGTKVDSALLNNLLTKNTNMLSKVIKDPKVLQSATQTLTRIEANGYKITLQIAEKMNPTNAKIASKFITNPENYKTAMVWIARVEAAGIEVTSDTLQSFLQMYCQAGQFDEATFINGLIMSVGGNVLGHAVGAATDLKGTKSILDGDLGSADAELTPSHPHTSEADTHNSVLESANSTATNPSVNPHTYTEPPKSVVSTLFAKLPSVSLRKAGEQILEKIKNLKNLVDYNEIKNKIEIFYQNYKEVREQLLNWLDEKFKTIGKIIKHENYKIGEFECSEFEIEKIIYANNKKTFNNALKDIIPDNALRETALEKTIVLGEEFKFLQGQKEITVTYDGTSMHIKEVDLEAKAKREALRSIDSIDAIDETDNAVKFDNVEEPDNIAQIETFDTPRTMELLGEKLEINRIETLENGEKILWCSEGTIKVDAKNRPIEFKPKAEDMVVEFVYESENATTPSKLVGKNSNGDIIKIQENSGNKITEIDYEQGIKYIFDKDSGVSTTSFLNFDEYPKVLDQGKYISNLQTRIADARSIEELEKLKEEFARFKAKYNNTTDLAVDFNNKFDKLLPKEHFIDKKTVSNLRKYSLKKNQELIITAEDRITLGTNGYELKLDSPEIKSKLEKLRDGESLTIGRADITSDADIQLPNADMTVSRNHLTITKKGDSYVVKDNSMNGTVIYSDKSPSKIHNGEIELPSKVKESGFTTLENYSLEKTIEEIQATNNPKNKIKITDGNGTIDFCENGIVSKLIYKDGKLVASFANGSYYGYALDGTRLLIDEATYTKLLNEALITKYTTEIKGKGFNTVDKTVSNPPTIIEQFEPTIVTDNAHISLANQCDIFLDTEPFKSMTDGQSIIVGKLEGLPSHAGWHQFNGVADEHLLIQKINGKFVITSLTDKGSVIKVPKRNPTPLTPIEKQIKTGNKPTEITSSKTLDINDPMYEDIPKISEYLHTKMEAQMGVVKPEEISAWADNLSKKYGIPKQEVLDIMSRLTQFGSYSQLEKLGQKLSSLGVDGFYLESGISSNSALNYIAEKKHQFALSGTEGKKAFILDDAGLKYIENLDGIKKQEFIRKVDNGEVVLINLDGTGLEIGNNCYSYTALDGGQSLEAMTEAVIIQMREGKSLDAVINGNSVERINIALGSDIAKKIETVQINGSKGNNVSTIANQIKPNIPSTAQIRATIEGYVESLNLPEDEIKKAKILLAKYVDHMLKMCSNDSFVEVLKNKHLQIEQYVKSLGKSMDDVIYVYPTKGKSFELIDYMYAKVNDIDSSKIVFDNGTTKFPEGKVVVLLDDVVGSGATMLHQEFNYSAFIQNNPNSTMIFSPITCSQEGHNNIISSITSKNRPKDKLLYDDTMMASFPNFTKQLSSEDAQYLVKIVFGGQLGFGNNALCTSFQYMVPDNCTSFSGYLLNFNLNNSSANKLHPQKNVLDIIRSFVDKYI